jgi:NADPH-dependent ferric siderophore reductase
MSATFVTTVASRTVLNRSFLQLTLRGGDLQTFRPKAPDQFVYVLAPPLGRRDLTIDASFTWTEWEAMPEAERPRGAYYSVRAWRPEVAEMDLIVVRHEGGAASGWAEDAEAGDAVAVWGPRDVYAPPASTCSLLLVADETGLPALAAILEGRSPGMPAIVVVELGHESLAIPLRIEAADRVVWVRRGEAAPGTTSLLLDAVRRVVLPGDVYAWGGAESRIMTTIRRHLRDEVGLAQEQVAMTGYWRLGSADNADG